MEIAIFSLLSIPVSPFFHSLDCQFTLINCQSTAPLMCVLSTAEGALFRRAGGNCSVGDVVGGKELVWRTIDHVSSTWSTNQSLLILKRPYLCACQGTQKTNYHEEANLFCVRPFVSVNNRLLLILLFFSTYSVIVNFFILYVVLQIDSQFGCARPPSDHNQCLIESQLD